MTDVSFIRILKSPEITAVLWEEEDCDQLPKPSMNIGVYSHRDRGNKRCTGGLSLGQ